MDVKKSIQDAGYIAVGAGVIGFQQAQVRRREIGTELTRRAHAARTCVRDTTSKAAEQVADQVSLARDQVTGTVGGRASDAWDVASSAAWDAATSITDRAGALAEDVVEWVDPVLGELKVRVEPLVEQLQAMPEQLTKVVSNGRSRVLTLVGTAA
jgi:hypothetical protein